jgi:hypothetical protein
MDDRCIHQKIYGELERLLPMAQLPDRWQTRPTPAGYLESPPVPEQLLAKLLGQFPLLDLVAAGVVLPLQEAGAKAQLHPQLSVPGGKWLALRETPDSPPFDFVWDGGTLSGELPVLAVQRDHLVSTLLFQDGCDLLVAGTLEDAAVLLAAGLPATVSAGLAHLQQHSFQKFCDAFKLYRPGDPREVKCVTSSPDEHGRHAVEPSPPQLIFVGWSPGQFGLQAPLQNQVREYLEALYRQLQIPVDRFGWWEPSVDDLDRLIFAVRIFDAGRLTAFLIESLEYSTDIVRSEPRKQPPPNAARVFAKTPQHSFVNPLASAQRSAERFKVLEQEVLTPLLQETNKSDDPLKRNLKLMLVQLSTVCHNSVERAHDAFHPTKKGLDDEDGGAAKLAHLPMLVTLILKITREIRGRAD